MHFFEDIWTFGVLNIKEKMNIFQKKKNCIKIWYGRLAVPILSSIRQSDVLKVASGSILKCVLRIPLSNSLYIENLEFRDIWRYLTCEVADMCEKMHMFQKNFF